MIAVQWVVASIAGAIVYAAAFAGAAVANHFGYQFTADHIVVAGLLFNAIFDDIKKVKL